MNQSHRILNRVPSRDTHLDWTHEHAAIAFPTALARPVSLDLRSPDWAIGDQMNTGSCVGWATAEGVMRWLLARSGRIALADRLSSRFVWMAAKETDTFRSQATTFIEHEGTSVKAAASICTKFGSVKEDVLPFNSGFLYYGETGAFYAGAAQLKASSYYNLSRASSEAWRNWIAQHGPILIGLEVDATWDRADSSVLTEFQKDTVRGSHAASIVGYTSDTFIVRNSWGAGWGDKGFAYVSDAYARAAFPEAYGLTI